MGTIPEGIINKVVHQIFQFHRRLSKVVQAKIFNRHNKVIGDLQEVATKGAQVTEEETTSAAIHVCYFKATNPL